jgi:hypothetical protein
MNFSGFQAAGIREGAIAEFDLPNVRVDGVNLFDDHGGLFWLTSVELHFRSS